ncbi:MAG TPA: hypothetical protein DEA63_03280, partial [Firmicutes bacterium]|nr:hypothetical protein [Bacillota bacterium]
MNLFRKFKSKFSKIALSFSLLLGTLTGIVGVSSVGYAASRAGVSDWLIPNVSASYSSSLGAEPTWECISTSSFRGSLKGGFLISHDSTLVLTNQLGGDAQVLFNFNTTGSTVTVDGKECNSSTSGTVNRKWPKDATIEIKIEVARKTTATVSINDFSLIDLSKKANVTFIKSEFGTFSASHDGNSLSFGIEYNLPPTSLVKLIATPDEGCVFIGWKKSNSFISYNRKLEYAAEAGTYTISAVFSKEDYAVFCTGNQFFDDLNKADEVAASGTKQIFVSKSGPILKGNYALSAGVSLTVPMDASNQFVGDTPVLSSSLIGPSEYCCLTLKPGAILTVSDSASISVASTMFAHSGGGTSARPSGGYGRIQLDEGSSIVLSNGASLYCWGFISGAGSVIAESGSTVHEMFQI